MTADIVLINGKLLSIGHDKKTEGEAVAVKSGIVQAIGSTEEIREHIGESTEIIDCRHGTIIPGFCDAHCHPASVANTFISCQLFDIIGMADESCEEVIRKYQKRLREYCDKHKSEEVIKGNGWNRAYFMGTCKNKKLPDRHDLDIVCNDRPVVLDSYCMHCAWANTKAIEMAGLSEKTPDTKTGRIVREENGYPSGIFYDIEAINLLKENLENYDYTVEQYKEAIRYYQDNEAVCYGVTLANECLCTDNAIQAYWELAHAGELKVRFRAVHHLVDCSPEKLQSINKHKGKEIRSDCFSINTIKMFLEGDFSLSEPYEDEYIAANGLEVGFSGKNFFTDEQLLETFKQCLKVGYQIHLHAMGDEAVSQAVRCLAKAQKNGSGDMRNIIAHLMLADCRDMKTMAENNIIANVQPRWMIYDSDMEENYIPMMGYKRAMNSYPCKSFYDAGCIVSFGTDFPVTPPPNPFHGLQCAVTRKVFKGDEKEYKRYSQKTLGIEDSTAECISLHEAIRSYTWSGAYQNYLEDVTGSIEIGKSADIAVLDRDLEAIPVEEIYNAKVSYTLFKGEIVYKKGEANG